MKRKIIFTGLLAVALACQGAQAKTLEDVLKEKGVITEADYKEITKVKPFDYKPGKGFTMTSPDQKFQLSLGGRLQARYSFLDKDTTTQDVSEWRIRRMKVWLNGYAYTKDLTYLLQVDMVNSNTNKFIDHAYLDYKLIDEARVLIGQTKIPFGRQWLVSSGSLSFVDRAAASDYFRPGYDIGVKLHGKIAKGLVNYDIGGYGGKGQGVVSTGNDNSIAARVAINPLGDMPYSEADLDTSAKPLVSVGANYFYDRLKSNFTAATTSPAAPASTTLETNNLNLGFLSGITTGNGFNKTEKVDVNLVGLDAAFKWMGVYATGEYFLGQVEGSNTGAEVRSQGYLLQAGYCILPKKLEAAMRYGYIDPNRAKANDLRSEIGGAVSYYFDKHNLKLQGDISSIHNQATASNKDEMQYRLQAQVIF